MDEADDAVGRVAIFSIEPAAGASEAPPPVERGTGHMLSWMGALADDPRSAVLLGVGLVLLLVLGLRLTH
jgi:hypothetical protein